MVDVINPNITAGIGQQGQLDPLSMFAKYAYTQNALLQGQQLRAKAAAGQLYSQSLGPDGQPDLAKYGIMLKAHPETSMYAEEAMNEAVTTRRLNADLLQTQLQNKRTQMEGVAGVYGAASQDPRVHNAGDFAGEGYVSQLHDLGIPTPELVSLLADPNKLGNLKEDDLRNYLKMHSQALQHGATQAELLTGQFTQHLSQNPDGSWNSGWENPHYNTAQAVGQPPFLGGQQGAASAGPTTAAGALTAPGANVPSNPLSPTQPPQVPNAPASTGPRYGEMAPSKAGSLKWMGEQYFPDLQKAATSAQSFLNIVKEGRQLLNTAATGRAAPTRTEISRWMLAAGLNDQQAREIAGGDPYNSQALSKLILYIGTQGMSQANQGNAAVRSVQEWNKFMEANPNLANDKQAITKMWDFMSYQASLITQQQQEYNTWDASKRDLTQFPAKWNAFQDDQTDKYIKSRFGGNAGGQ